MRTKKNGTPDLRFKSSRTLVTKEFMFWKIYGNYVVSVILGLLAGLILGKTIYDASRPILDPRGTPTGKVKVQEVIAAEPRFCDYPVKCIRDVGEELGESNEHIMAMVRLAKCESGNRPDALNKNRNGTFDVGLLQINDVHGKRISRADRLDYEKNIRFAYQLHQEQGHSFNAWSCWKKVK